MLNNRILSRNATKFLNICCKNCSTSTITQQQEQKEKQYPRKIFSGIQPTGAIHLGNYLGAIAQWVRFQDNNENVTLMIADLHSMTLPHDPKVLSRNIMEITATLLGCGIDTDKVLLLQQSQVPAHTELSWYLGCIATMARLAHLPAYKEKSATLKDIPLGLFVYPVLQSADILAHKATHVPVGEDQQQHIQLVQELARMFNNRFGNTFPIPHSIIADTEFARLKSLRDPLKKMSKSDPDSKSRVCLTDPPDEIVKKIKKAVTDFTSEVTFDPEKRPGVSNLISMHSFVTNKPVDEICKEVTNLNTGQYKMLVAEVVVEHVKPIQQKISLLLDDPQYLIDTVKIGSEKCKEITSRTLMEVKKKLGTEFKVKTKRNVKVVN